MSGWIETHGRCARLYPRESIREIVFDGDYPRDGYDARIIFTDGEEHRTFLGDQTRLFLQSTIIPHGPSHPRVIALSEDNGEVWAEPQIVIAWAVSGSEGCLPIGLEGPLTDARVSGRILIETPDGKFDHPCIAIFNTLEDAIEDFRRDRTAATARA